MTKKIKKIGVFDSGAGGLSVVKSLLENDLFEEIIYYGDTARVPYGIKDKNTIIRYGLEALEFFKNFDIDLLIVACNTVSAYALEEMREQSDCEIIGVVEPGVLALRSVVQNKKDHVLILGTNATVNSRSYQTQLQKLGYSNVEAMATGLFVSLVEERILNGPIVEETMKHYFQDISPKAVILGCTHFPLLQERINSYFAHSAKMIHSGDAIATYLLQRFDCRQQSRARVQFFASENPGGLKAIAKSWLGEMYE
ncbi:MAG: glutamate racemase [Campylobacterota bacterium]